MKLPIVLPLSLLMVASAALLHAQAFLRPGASGRATSQVVLTFPRPAAGTPAPPVTTDTVAPRPIIIRLDYGQPHLRGRALHGDSLVPYDKPWRMGANNPTTLTTDIDLVVGGAPLAKGSYVLYTIPRRAGWTLVVQRSAGQTAQQFDDSHDVVRIPLRHANLSMPLESFTMWLIPSLESGPARGELRLAWGSDQLSTDWSIR